jgi:hypothetical protein
LANGGEATGSFAATGASAAAQAAAAEAAADEAANDGAPSDATRVGSRRRNALAVPNMDASRLSMLHRTCQQPARRDFED